MFLSPPKARRRRRGRAYSGGFAGPSAPRRRRGPSLLAVAIAVLVIAAIGGAIYVATRTVLKPDHRREAVVTFVEAWERGDQEAMYALLDAPSRKANPRDLVRRRLPARQPGRRRREDHGREDRRRCARAARSRSR